MARDRTASPLRLSGWTFAAVILGGLVLLFLAPYVFLGRSMVPLDFLPVLQPWARHAGELWGSVPRIHNPLLDSIQQYYPRRVYMREALSHGWLPLWNPDVYGGSPFLAAQQGAVLYPPAWLLALLPPELQFGWSAVLHLAAAGLGALLFFRVLGLRPAAALTGAVAFAFNGYVIVWLAYPNVTQWTLCWLPTALWAWERGRSAGDMRWYAACAGLLALNVLGGHGQSSEYSLLVWGCWAVVRLAGDAGGKRVPRWGNLGRALLLPAALAVLLALGHLLPSLEFVPRTDRGGRVPWASVQSAAMPPAQLWTLVVPRLFGDQTEAFGNQSWLPAGGRAPLAYVERSFYPGVAVLVLAAGGFAYLRRRRGSRTAPEEGGERARRLLAWFGLCTTVLALAWALGTPLYWPLWRLVPGFGNFTAVARIISIAAWALACLAALGVDALDRADYRRSAFPWIAGAAGLCAAALGAAWVMAPAPAAIEAFLREHGYASAEATVNRDLLLGIVWATAPPAFAYFLVRRPPDSGSRHGWAAWGCAGVVFLDLLWFGFGFNPATPPEWAHLKTPEIDFLRSHAAGARVLSLGSAGRQMDPVQRMASNLPSVWGLADLGGSDSFVTLRYRAWEAALRAASPGFEWARPGSPNLRSAAVRYYLTGSREPFPGLREAVGTEVQEDPGVLPYARLHPFAKALPSKEGLFQALGEPNRATAVALTTGAGAPDFEGPPAVVPFTVAHPTGNRVTVEGASPEPGLLVVCEQWDPAWHAWVDGAPARALPAEGLFTGVPLPGGTHRVELRYEPASFRVGTFGTLCGLALLCGLLTARRSGRRETPCPSRG